MSMTLTNGTATLTFKPNWNGVPITPYNTDVTIAGNVRRQVGETRAKFNFEKAALTESESQTLMTLFRDTSAYLTLTLDRTEDGRIPFGETDTTYYVVFTSELKISEVYSEASLKSGYECSFTMEEVLYI